MKLVSVEMSKEEAKEYGGAVPASDANLPKYPWGLCLELNDDTMAKLGMTELPKVDATMLIEARVVVTSVGSSKQQGGDEEMRCSLQITELAVGADKPAKSDKEIMYGSGKK